MDESTETPVRTTSEAQAPAVTAEPVPQTPPVPAPTQEHTPPNTPAKINKRYLIIGILLLLGVIVFGVLYAGSITPAKEEVPATATPAVILTPTPPPNISRIATTSAFTAFSQEIASFSAMLESFTFQDSTLAPPILDLELNLTN